MDPGPIFTIDTSSIVTVYLLQTIITIHTIQLAGEINNLTISWGKVLSLCCAGFHVACNTFEAFSSSYWFDNLGFLPRETCLLYCIITSTWGLPTKCCYTHQGFFWRRCRGG